MPLFPDTPKTLLGELALKGAPEDATETALLQYALKKLGS